MMQTWCVTFGHINPAGLHNQRNNTTPLNSISTEQNISMTAQYLNTVMEENNKNTLGHGCPKTCCAFMHSFQIHYTVVTFLKKFSFLLFLQRFQHKCINTEFRSELKQNRSSRQ